MKFTNTCTILATAFLITFFSTKINATHIVGGDLSYECLGNNQYRITMRVYRDCFAGQAGLDNPAKLQVYTGPNGNIPFGAVQNVFLSSDDNIPPVISNPCLTPPSNICVEEGVYERTLTLPYNSNGYHISYQRCCRNNSITNIFNPQSSGATYTIYISDEAQQTCNNSPVFNDFPPIVICAGQDIDFDNSATDSEGDQLVYSFCAPFLGGTTNMPVPDPASPPYSQVLFAPPFTAAEPLGGNPTVTIDPVTGLISGIPTQLGQFVVGVCVEEYRTINGVQTLMSLTKRDFQFNVVNCQQSLTAAVEADIIVDIDGYIINECADPTVTFDNESSSDPTGLIDSYLWEFDAGNGDIFTSSSINPTFTFPGIGTYNGILVANPGNPTCTDTAEITVVINPDITADFDITFDPCSLAPIQFTDQTIAEAGGVMYDWDFGDGNTSTDQNPTHEYAPGDYTITLNVEDVNGCTNQISQDITYYPTPDIAFDVSDPIGCGGHSVTFTNNSQPLTNDYDVEWDFGDGNTSTENSPTNVYDTEGSYDVSLTITSSTGCTGTETFSSIEIQSGPLIGFDFSDPCIVGPISFTNNTTASGAPITNTSWNFGDGSTSSEISPTHEYATPGSYDVTLVVSDSEGCTTTLEQTVNYFPPSVINTAPSVTEGCEPLTVSFTNTSAPFTADYTVNWDFGDGNTSTDFAPTHTYDTPGTYTVSIGISPPGAACTSEEVYNNLITVRAAPEVDFSFSDLCEFGPIDFTGNITQGSGSITNIVWNFGDGNSSTQQSPTHNYSAPGIYTVTLDVTDEFGCADNFSETIEYFPSPVTNVSFAPEGCTPHTAVFTNNSEPLNIGYNIEWDFGDGNTSIQTSPTHLYDTPGTYTVTLTMTSPSGCVTEEIYTDAIFVQAGPVAAFDFSDPCELGPITFTNNTTQGDGAITSTEWDFGDGNGSSDNSPVHEYAAPGTYTVTLDITDANGCVNSTTQNISYFPSPVIDIIFDDEGCTPHTVTFQNNSIPITPTFTFEWDFGDGNTSGSLSPTHTYDTPGTYTVSLVMTSPNGCVSQETFVDAVFVQVGPAMAFSYSDLCVLGPVQFTDETTIGDGALNGWTWDFGDGNSSTDQNPIHEYADPGTYNVILTITDVNGCENQLLQTLDYFPSLDIQVDIPNAGCTPFTLDFTNNTTPFTDQYTIEWDFGDGNTSTEENPTHTYTTPDMYDVTVTIGSPTGCQVAQTFTDAVFVQAGPATNFNFVFDSCAYEPAQYLDQTVAGDGNLTNWNWDFGDGNTSTEQNPLHAFDDPGSYDVSLTVLDDNGCEISFSQVVDWFPTPFISVELDQDEGCQPLTVTFDNNTFPLAGYATDWDFGDGNTGTDQEPVHTYLYAGTYDVNLVVTSPIGCQETEFYPALIRVDSVPAVSFLPNDGTCLDGPVDFVDLTPPNGGDIISWSWDFGDGNTSTEQNPTHEYDVSDTYDVSLTVVAENGCSSTITNSINWEYIPGIAFDVDAPQGCLPHTVEFMNEADSIAGWTLTWDFGDGGTATGLNPVHTYQNTGTYDVTLTLASPFGCVIETLYPAYIQVDTIPIAGFQFDYSCEDAAVNFADISIATGAPIVEWNWDFGDGESSTEQNPEHVYPPVADVFTITLTITDANGCTDSASQDIEWFPSAQIDFEADDNFGCAPHIVTFFNNTMPLDPTYELLWDLGNGTTSTELEPVVNYDTGTYTVSLTVTAPTGCVTNVTLPNYIQVTAPPVAGFTYNPENPTNLNPEVSFTETSENDTEWLWDFGNGDTSNQPNPMYTYPDTGYYNVTLYVSQASGCTDSITQVIDISPEFTYFLPNAFTPNFDDKNDGFKGKGVTWTLQDFEMLIFNRWGEQIFQTNDPNEAWNGRKNNSGQPSPNGVYVYLVTLTDGRGEQHEYKGYATLVR